MLLAYVTSRLAFELCPCGLVPCDQYLPIANVSILDGFVVKFCHEENTPSAVMFHRLQEVVSWVTIVTPCHQHGHKKFVICPPIP